MSVWKFRNATAAYPNSGLLESVLEARGSSLEAVSGDPRESPFQIAGMNQVARRLVQAITAREKVLVFGDYDCDGICGTLIMCRFLKQYGVHADPLLPTRQEGYGIHPDHVYRAAQEKYNLIVTVDNGITAFDAAEAACSLGLEMVVTDHHEPLSTLPRVPIANPKLPGTSGCRDLSGTGVAYKVCCAVSKLIGKPSPDEFLDLVALATVVDVCPLTGENFLLARNGLLRMRQNTRPGIAALLKTAGVSRITGQVMGWVLGPGINAAGRVGDPALAYRLIAAETAKEAEEPAQELEKVKKERQSAVKQVTAACLTAYDNTEFGFFTSDDWGEGIIGLAAGRVMEAILRPVAVGVISDDQVHFSARAPGEFDLIKALDECQRRTQMLIRHGGHRAAAGFSMLSENLPFVKQTLCEIAREMLKPEDTAEWLEIDARLESVPTPQEVLRLDLLEPHGNKNPEPTFYLKDYAVEVKTGPGWSLVRTASGLKFFAAEPAPEGEILHTALSLAIDEYRGARQIIGRAVDTRPFLCAREDLLERYLAWRVGKKIPAWAEVIFNELGLSRTGNNEKTSLLKSSTFLKYGFVKY